MIRNTKTKGHCMKLLYNILKETSVSLFIFLFTKI